MRLISCRPPLGLRIACVLFSTGVSIAVVAANTADYASGRASAVVFVPVFAMVLILMTLAYRVFRLSFRTDPAGVVIRSIFRTRHIPVAQLTGFDVIALWFFSEFTVRVITQSRAFPIRVYTIRNGPFRGRRNLNHLCDVADELNAWLADAREHKASEVAGSALRSDQEELR